MEVSQDKPWLEATRWRRVAGSALLRPRPLRTVLAIHHRIRLKHSRCNPAGFSTDAGLAEAWACRS